MALKASYDSKDQIPTGQESFYVERSGKWVLDAEGVEDVTGLKRNQAELLEDLKKAQKKLKDYEGVDPAEFKKLKDAADKAAEEAAKASGNWEAREKQLKELHANEMAKVKADLDVADRSIQRILVENTLRKELDPVTLTGGADLLMPHASRSVRVVKGDDGEHRAVVVDEKGNPRIKDAQGNPFTITDLVKEMSTQPTFAPAFKGSGGSGSGGRGSDSAGGAKTISASDTKGFLDNIADIASGKIKVA